MKQSQLFTKTSKTAPAEEQSTNAKLLLRGGFIHKEVAGAYAFLPLGLRVLNNIIAIIREEMNVLGAQEVLLTSLQNPELWKKTKRWDDSVIDVWFKTTLNNEAELGLANTHEEPIAALMSHHLSSWRDLPVSAYQFQTKFRNELRVRSGLLRSREFIMKDLYSFSRSQEEHEMFYELAKKAYRAIFDRIGIGEQTLLTFASGGSFSKYSHEFQTLCEAGEDTIFVCGKCRVAVNKEIIKEQPTCPQCSSKNLEEKRAIEVGNIFNLGTKFSELLGLKFVDEQGTTHAVVMGSYGIGPGRAMGTAVELFHDEKGIRWPAAIAPFSCHLLAFPGAAPETAATYEKFKDAGISVLYDDREVSPGEKMADADLLGMPWRLIQSEKTGAEKVEMKKRDEKNVETLDITDVIKRLKP
ncbi:MAG: prolyl-tRNA synthetase [Parcubacteria group bacterium]|nr:prolyl-tRNA synthetase [Parcubacteria group bacterium]